MTVTHNTVLSIVYYTGHLLENKYVAIVQMIIPCQALKTLQTFYMDLRCGDCEEHNSRRSEERSIAR